MHFDIVEIGTADFDSETQIEKGFFVEKFGEVENKRILSVEPVKRYLDNLPVLPNSFKEHAAVSNRDGEIDIWFVSPENIVKYGFPGWTSGCNSVNNPHPLTFGDYQKMSQEQNHPAYMRTIADIFTVDTVKCITFKMLAEKYDITSISFLKVDAEGHDTIILNDYFQYCQTSPQCKANWIVFEANELTSSGVVDECVRKAEQLGYILRQRNYDTILQLDATVSEGGLV
jgi:hypothetical protein